MTQLGLYDPPRTHADDPATSHRAEERMRRGGKMARHRRRVLALVSVNPGRTASELAALDATDFWAAGLYQRTCQIRKRLSDLHTAGEIRVVGSAGRESRWEVAR